MEVLTNEIHLVVCGSKVIKLENFFPLRRGLMLWVFFLLNDLW